MRLRNRAFSHSRSLSFVPARRMDGVMVMMSSAPVIEKGGKGGEGGEEG